MGRSSQDPAAVLSALQERPGHASCFETRAFGSLLSMRFVGWISADTTRNLILRSPRSGRLEGPPATTDAPVARPVPADLRGHSIQTVQACVDSGQPGFQLAAPEAKDGAKTFERRAGLTQLMTCFRELFDRTVEARVNCAQPFNRLPDLAKMLGGQLNDLGHVEALHRTAVARKNPLTAAPSTAR